MSRTAEVGVFYGGVVVAFPELAFLTLCRVPLTSQGGVILGRLRRRKDLRMLIGLLFYKIATHLRYGLMLRMA